MVKMVVGECEVVIGGWLDTRNCLKKDMSSTDGAVEVWCCPTCNAHRVTVMRDGKRNVLKQGGPELARFHDKSLIPDSVLVVWDCEVLS